MFSGMKVPHGELSRLGTKRRRNFRATNPNPTFLERLLYRHESSSARKFCGTKVPPAFRAYARKFPGTKVPWHESSPWKTFAPRHENAEARKFRLP